MRTIFLLLPAALLGCTEAQNNKAIARPVPDELLQPSGAIIQERFGLPEGYKRIDSEAGSFAAYLRTLPLQPHGADVRYYNGKVKPRAVHVAVVRMDVGTKDLQQCADAIMRLRAEYLYSTKQYDKIHFRFTNGFNATYNRWHSGNRISVNGNKVSWTNSNGINESYQSFRHYLDIVFSYAGTLSLSKELLSVNFKDMQPGDVLIQGGSPGHAVMVVDVAVNKEGRKIYMLAQSYMPAQEIHVLNNPGNETISPWYELDDAQTVRTPEWNFTRNDLKRFPSE